MAAGGNADVGLTWPRKCGAAPPLKTWSAPACVRYSEEVPPPSALLPPSGPRAASGGRRQLSVVGGPDLLRDKGGAIRADYRK